MIVHAEGCALIADTGYDADRIVESARRLEMKPVIHVHPGRKKNRRRLDRRLYGLRLNIERFFHDLKRFRAAATRYEKTAGCYLAVLHVASLLIWLK